MAHVPTHLNPADCATRSVKANELDNSMWLSGPKFLRYQDPRYHASEEYVVPESFTDDPEVSPEIKTLATEVQKSTAIGTSRFTRFSLWSNLVKGVSKLISTAQAYNRSNKATRESSDGTTGIQPCDGAVERRKQAETVIIKNVQQEVFAKEIGQIKKGEKLPKGSVITKLSPMIDSNGLVRVGGRLERAQLTVEERHPIILPGSHNITTLIVKHYHHEVKHQGRHFTIVDNRRILDNRRRTTCEQCNSPLCQVQKVKGTTGTSKDGRPSSSASHLSPTLYLRRPGRFRTVSNSNTTNQRRRGL
jgi:hypothetical protein